MSKKLVLCRCVILNKYIIECVINIYTTKNILKGIDFYKSKTCICFNNISDKGQIPIEIYLSNHVFVFKIQIK